MTHKCSYCFNSTNKALCDFCFIGWEAFRMGRDKTFIACPKHVSNLEKDMPLLIKGIIKDVKL